MKPTTAKQVEMVLRKYTKQLKDKGTISVNEAATLARLTSACHRLTRSSGTQSNGLSEMSDDEKRQYLMEHGEPGWYEAMAGGK